MTVVDHPRPGTGSPPLLVDAAPGAAGAAVSPPAEPPVTPADAGRVGTLTPRRLVGLVACWIAVLLAASFVVIYPLGPVLQHRDQHALLRSFRTQLQQAADAKQGLAGLLAKKVPDAPSAGDPDAIIDLGSLRIRQVVLEGVDPQQTRRGPGHAPGTAGVGQPGNAVIIGRHAGWGAPFADLHRLRVGDRILATTTQGQSVYRVRTVRDQRFDRSLLSPSTDDRLTLVTSTSSWPLATGRATVVVAKLEGKPFGPLPQGGRTADGDGRHPGRDGLPQLAFFGTVFGLAAAASAFAQRRWRPLVAYLLTTPALVVLAILVAESISRLLPAWA
ncbi:MAG: sortase-like protein [Acidimicrobiales bacterium]|nr:sortase-like protein [Acidimicrobiales bacterium]